jgi:hypothetical protein
MKSLDIEQTLANQASLEERIKANWQMLAARLILW